MTELDKFAAQGKAYTDLKTARANVATLNVALLQYGRTLSEVAGLVSTFVGNPAAVNPSACVKLSEHLKATIQQLSTPEGVVRLIDELVEETARVKELQEQVDQF